jgi:hypothetical protein
MVQPDDLDLHLGRRPLQSVHHGFACWRQEEARGEESTTTTAVKVYRTQWLNVCYY